MNAPHTSIAHLGNAACVLLAAISGSIAAQLPGFQSWMLQSYYIIPLVFLALLTTAYLLEHALTTSAILLLLACAAVSAGLCLGGFGLNGAALTWQITAGPLCYFAAAALVLHHWADQLYRWQICCILTLAGLAGAALACWVTGGTPVHTICALLFTCSVATFELIVLFGKDYYEITSASRARSTALAMLMLQAMPVYKIIWNSLLVSRYGIVGLLRFVYHWFRWM